MNEETSTIEPWMAMSALDLGLIRGSARPRRPSV